jgi:predicted nucleotidyltransferase
MALAALLGQKRQDVLRIAGKYGARRVRIFGSVAHGEADSQSDVDFLVDLDPGRSLFDLGGLQFELEALLGCPVDVVTERGLRPRIRERMLREAVPVRGTRRNVRDVSWWRRNSVCDIGAGPGEAKLVAETSILSKSSFPALKVLSPGAFRL